MAATAAAATTPPLQLREWPASAKLSHVPGTPLSTRRELAHLTPVTTPSYAGVLSPPYRRRNGGTEMLGTCLGLSNLQAAERGFAARQESFRVPSCSKPLSRPSRKWGGSAERGGQGTQSLPTSPSPSPRPCPPRRC